MMYGVSKEYLALYRTTNLNAKGAKAPPTEGLYRKNLL